MCSNEEIGRSVQLGISVGSGWYMTALAMSTPTAPINDCHGWTDNTNTYDGLAWTTIGSVNACNVSNLVLCCD